MNENIDQLNKNINNDSFSKPDPHNIKFETLYHQMETLLNSFSEGSAEYKRIKKWMKKLKEGNYLYIPQKRNRNLYARLLILCMLRGKLDVPPFHTVPPKLKDPLPTLPSNLASQLQTNSSRSTPQITFLQSSGSALGARKRKILRSQSVPKLRNITTNKLKSLLLPRSNTDTELPLGSTGIQAERESIFEYSNCTPIIKKTQPILPFFTKDNQDLVSFDNFSWQQGELSIDSKDRISTDNYKNDLKIFESLQEYKKIDSNQNMSHIRSGLRRPLNLTYQDHASTLPPSSSTSSLFSDAFSSPVSQMKLMFPQSYANEKVNSKVNNYEEIIDSPTMTKVNSNSSSVNNLNHLYSNQIETNLSLNPNHSPKSILSINSSQIISNPNIQSPLRILARSPSSSKLQLNISSKNIPNDILSEFSPRAKELILAERKENVYLQEEISQLQKQLLEAKKEAEMYKQQAQQMEMECLSVLHQSYLDDEFYLQSIEQLFREHGKIPPKMM